MTTREELAKVISDALGTVTGIYDTTHEEDRAIADAILAAGFGKLPTDPTPGLTALKKVLAETEEPYDGIMGGDD